MLRRLAKSDAEARAARPVHELLAAQVPALSDTLAQVALERAALRRCQAEMRARLARALRRDHGRLALSAQPLEALLEREFASWTGAGSARVRAHPADLASLGPELCERWNATLGDLELVADASLSPGGCLIERTGQLVDARLETRFAELCSLLIDLAEGSPSPGEEP